MKHVRVTFTDGSIETYDVDSAGALEAEARVLRFTLTGEKTMICFNIDQLRGWIVTEDE